MSKACGAFGYSVTWTSRPAANRHAASDPQQRLHARTAGGKDDVRRQRDQFFCVSPISIESVSCPAGVSAHIAALYPSFCNACANAAMRA